MQTHTGTHRYTHSHVQTRAHAHKRTHAHKRAIVIGRVTHANQFHSLARCQVAMLSKYYHNSCVSEYAANEWMTWHPVKLRDTETEERNCPLTVTVPECLLHLPTVLLTSGSLCLFLSARFFLLSFFFFFLQRTTAPRSAQQRGSKNGRSVTWFYLRIWTEILLHHTGPVVPSRAPKHDYN